MVQGIFGGERGEERGKKGRKIGERRGLMSGGEEWMKDDRVGSREESGESKEERGSRLVGGSRDERWARRAECGHGRMPMYSLLTS